MYVYMYVFLHVLGTLVLNPASLAKDRGRGTYVDYAIHPIKARVVYVCMHKYLYMCIYTCMYVSYINICMYHTYMEFLSGVHMIAEPPQCHLFTYTCMCICCMYV